MLYDNHQISNANIIVNNEEYYTAANVLMNDTKDQITYGSEKGEGEQGEIQLYKNENLLFFPTKNLGQMSALLLQTSNSDNDLKIKHNDPYVYSSYGKSDSKYDCTNDSSDFIETFNDTSNSMDLRTGFPHVNKIEYSPPDLVKSTNSRDINNNNNNDSSLRQSFKCKVSLSPYNETSLNSSSSNTLKKMLNSQSNARLTKPNSNFYPNSTKSNTIQDTDDLLKNLIHKFENLYGESQNKLNVNSNLV
jgi:hypothetical protein